MTPTAAVPHTTPTVSAVLGPIHESWTEEVKWFLCPATDAQAGFWMAVGRRRGVAEPTAELARRFLSDLGPWWAELELATADVHSGDLPPSAGALLDRLRVADELTK